jgi:VanZ family protein
LFFLRERPHYVRIAGLVALFLIVVLSIIPGRMQIRTSAPKEFEHFVGYFIVASALAFGYRRLVFASAVGIFLIAVAGVLEQVQKLVPGRTPTLADWAASTMGVILGTVFVVVLGNLLLAKRHRRKDT